MNRLTLVLVFFLSSLELNASDVLKPKNFNAELKHKLFSEISLLETTMLEARGEISQLSQDKINIDTQLKQMEEWGKAQEEQKNDYYAQVLECNQKISEVQALVDTEKEKGKATLLKYHRAKSILGYIFGLLLAFIYTQLGSQFVTSLLSLVGGPWTILLRFLGPAAAFGAGYLLVNILL
jgi:uncharacterized membrane protein